MFDKNVKVIDVRFIGCKTLLVQILKLIAYIQHSLENSGTDSEVTITLKIKNRYKVKLHAAIDDKNISALPHNNTLTIGD